ncbi:hypothetical protein CR983_02235 [Candidatus Saccharibacteria bacterium]|nr:MAG: hypothetical protein CR983_02235 [Candidatus Saccharibacteria bacterium]
MARFRLVAPAAYADQLIASIDAARYRVNILALVFNEDKATRGIIDALCRASQRGVTVSVGLDIYFTFKEIGADASKWHYVRERVQRMRATKNRLNEAGVHVRWLGQFGATLFSRRTHTKWSIADDEIFSFGGINIYRDAFNQIDYMLHAADSRIAERLSAEHELIINSDRAGRAYPSHTFGIKHGAVLIDGGRLFDSVIYRRACSLAEQAERVVYVSQYCPTGRLASILRRTDTTFYFNDWRRAVGVLNRLHIRLSSLIHRIDTSYKHETYLHAKFILYYMLDGSIVALSGSHNFVASGGIMGTREAALETRDAYVIAELEAFLRDRVA